jgi:mono/diheme cytochrome c family protein/ketosteroid isomerase-like protein
MPFVTRKSLYTLGLLLLAAILLLAAFVWSGIYNVGADDPHTRPVLAVMESLRERSIHARSRDIALPNLDDALLVSKGAGQYAAMCTGCHLAPGMEDSEIRPGLYPRPPDLSRTRVDPREAFWVIKHGVKMSAMPAWGGGHDDQTIWSMVAFLQKLPDLSPAQYKEIVANAPADHHAEGGDHQHGDQGGDAAHAEMSGTAPPDTAAHADGRTGGHEDDGHSHSHDAAAGGRKHPTEAAAVMDGFSPKAVPAAEAVAEAFHSALKRGDRTTVLALLAPEARISEGGETQSRAEYAAGHLGADIAFLGDAQVRPLSLASMPMGDAAMVSSTSVIQATHDGKALSLLSSEMLDLKKTDAGWRITRVEWTSKPQDR